MQEKRTVYTIGHSTRDFDEFVEMLKSFQIETLVDIRSFPGSRKFPQYNKETLEKTIPEKGIKYIHLKSLGGRRKVKPDSHNTRWRSDAFKGYADYMETPEFEKGMEELIEIAKNSRTAYMCSEAVWWRCHRSMVSDYLKAKNWLVLHIMALGKADEHPYTQPAQVKDNHVFYCDLD